MNAPWLPVVVVDVIGSLLILVIAFFCFRQAWEWKNKMPNDTFRYYIYLLTASFVFFAISRSVGHLVKQCLLYLDMGHIWKEISPYSGAINTATFIIIFAISIYFQWERKAHEQITEYKNHLEALVKSLKNKSVKLEAAHKDLKASQLQLLQREKMASIGQLAAGVAHEINNPTGFIASNLGSLAKYVDRLTEYINIQSKAVKKEAEEELNALRKKSKIGFIVDDAKELIKESLDGTDRIKKIVQGLKSFSRVDEADGYTLADINDCLESTLNIVWNELKYKATVTKEYGTLPLTNCYPQQLNQVFMNLLVNAAHAIEKQGEIAINTWHGDGAIFITVSDTGCGIEPENINRIFEPFFTTKEVGKGTGLGLSISYDIIKKHNGEVTVQSELGNGTMFTIQLPVVTQIPS